VNGRAS